MAATTITLRNTKGSPLTNTEMDTNISLLNSYSKGYLSKTITTSTTLTDTEAENYFFAISGTLTADATITIPSILVKSWTVHNGTSGGFSITVRYATGAGITVLNGTRATFYFDGTDMNNISYSNNVRISDTGTVTNTMLAGSIANAKLSNSTISGVSLGSNLNALTIGTGLSGTSYNGSAGVTIAIDSTVALRADVHYIGSTSVALNRASANLALTGISSVTLPGSTSGTVQLIPTATVGTGTVLTIPAVTGTIVTTGDTGTVTNTMLAGSIAITKLASSTISGVSLGSNLNTLTIGTGLSGTSYNGSTGVTIAIDSTVALRADVHYIGSTSVALNRTSSNLALTGISSVTLPGSTSGTVQLIPTAAVGTGTILTIPATTGTIVTTGDTGTVTSTMILDGTILNADINASAAIAITKLASSTISGVSLGNNLNALTINSPLTGTSYNGSAAISIGIPAATASVNGYMTAAYAGKVDGLSYGAIAEIGRYIDFHGTYGTTNDFDVRFDCGASGVSGQGTLSVTAGNVAFSSSITSPGFYGTSTSNFQGNQTGSTLQNATGGLGGFMVQSLNSASAAFISFHKPGNYASYFGLDDDNQFAVGGWSAGAGLGRMKVGSLGVGTAASGTSGEIRATENITAYYTSDERLKENIITINNALEKVNKISGVNFDWTDEEIKARGGIDGYFVRKQDVGVIAQDIEKVLPEAVATRENGYKAVRYELLVPLLIEAIKELSEQNQQLLKRIEVLESK